MLKDRIKRLRKERGWSQNDLADRAGLGYATVARIETARQHPRHDTLEALAEAFGMAVPELLSEDEPLPDPVEPALSDLDIWTESEAEKAWLESLPELEQRREILSRQLVDDHRRVHPLLGPTKPGLLGKLLDHDLWTHKEVRLVDSLEAALYDVVKRADSGQLDMDGVKESLFTMMDDLQRLRRFVGDRIAVDVRFELLSPDQLDPAYRTGDPAVIVQKRSEPLLGRDVTDVFDNLRQSHAEELRRQLESAARSQEKGPDAETGRVGGIEGPPDDGWEKRRRSDEDQRPSDADPGPSE